MEGFRSQRLAEILGRAEDPSLNVVGISVDDGVVHIKLQCSDGILIQDYRADEARRVMADLITWSAGRDGI